MNERYPAYPLITCDPYFSVWSMNDNLNGDFTRHWTGRQQSLTGIIKVDGKTKVFMGKMFHDPDKNICSPENILQKSVNVTPMKTVYTFTDGKIELEVTFMTPLVLDDLKLMSRPVSYIGYKIKSMDGKKHKCTFYIDISALTAVNEPHEKVFFGKTDYSLYMTNRNGEILGKSGDDVRINWGHLHLAARGGILGEINDGLKDYYYRAASEKNEKKSADIYNREFAANDGYPAIYYANAYEVSDESAEDFVCIGYDDIHSAEYFGEKVDAYYKKDGECFSEIFKDSLDNYETITDKAENFEKKILSDAKKVSDDYAKLISIAYRQAVGAHKLVYTGEKALFISKECFSGGFAATLDVTYPSTPLFLKYNPDLAEYMLNPILDYAARKEWRYDFAPHDVGLYPRVNGQMYGVQAGEQQLSMQMPIEECGNALLCAAAICRAKNSADFAKRHFDILQKWSDYLMQFGFDPENQLCTDDFSGHLAHNCNLSVKAVMGIAAWGMVLKMMNRADGEKYINTAKSLASRWKEEAHSTDHYRLAFDKEDSWSIKYNLVWDKLFGLGIFDEEIFEEEVKYYKSKVGKYGLPLDSRNDYAKTDWQMWSTMLTDDKEYTDKVVKSLITLLSETTDHIPFTDFYFSNTGLYAGMGFRNRTVQGGLFINLLDFE